MSERIEAIAKRLGIDHGDTIRARFIILSPGGLHRPVDAELLQQRRGLRGNSVRMSSHQRRGLNALLKTSRTRPRLSNQVASSWR